MISAFGVDHGDISKGASEDAAKVLKEGLKFKPIKPGVKPTGPGSLRRKMDPSTSHWPGAAKRGVSKADKSKGNASFGRHVATQVFPGIHGAVAGRPGKKLRSTVTEAGTGIGGGIAGGAVGGAVGALVSRGRPAGAAIGGVVGGQAGGRGWLAHQTNRNNRLGRYSAQKKS